MSNYKHSTGINLSFTPVMNAEGSIAMAYLLKQ